MKKTIVGLAALIFILPALRGVARPLREAPSVMTFEQMQAYESGKSPDAALPAEAFGYPNPKRLLELESALQLSLEQKNQIQSIVRKLSNQSVYFGKKIVAEELILDDFFRKGQTDVTALANRLESIGGWRWRLRLTYLEAYVNARKVLSSDQLKKYQTLRTAPSEGASAK